MSENLGDGFDGLGNPANERPDEGPAGISNGRPDGGFDEIAHDSPTSSHEGKPMDRLHGGYDSKTKGYGVSDAAFADKMNQDGNKSSVWGSASNAKNAGKIAAQRRMIRSAVTAGFSDKLHEKIREYEDDNVGVEAAEKTSGAVEHVAGVADEMRQIRKIRQARQKSREYQEDKRDWTDDDIAYSEQDGGSDSAQAGYSGQHSDGNTDSNMDADFRTDDRYRSSDPAGFSDYSDSMQNHEDVEHASKREYQRDSFREKGTSGTGGPYDEGAKSGGLTDSVVTKEGLADKGFVKDDLTDSSVSLGGIHSGGRTGFYSSDSAGVTGFSGDSVNGAGSYGTEGYKSLIHEKSGNRQFIGAEEEVLKSPFQSNPESKFYQKKQIKRQYASALREKNSAAMAEKAGTKTAGGIMGKARDGLTGAGEAIAGFVKNHSHLLVMLGIAGLVIAIIAASVSSCTVVFQGTSEAVMGSSFTATTENIREAEDYYRGLEADLRQELANLEEDNPGYDEYRIERGEIGHNPFELAAFLTVLYEDYNLRKVKNTLDALFAAQYSLTQHASIETVTETRTVRVGESLGVVVTSGYCNCAACCGRYAGGPTASGVMPTPDHTIAVDSRNPFLPQGTRVVMNGIEYTVEDTGPLERYGVTFDIYYDDHDVAEAHGHQNWEVFLADDNGENEVTVTQTSTKNILTVSVNSHSLREIINNYDLTDVQRARFELLLQTKGNRPDLFPEDIYSNFSPGAYTEYDIPPEALSDARFANMIREGEKYLGYPYVWGGDSPETSFDCSGFVSWVINHCGNGWSYGRLTAEELRQVCAIIPPSEAKPGDLIFFQGTYDTDGASHVGIYVGNNTMMHCGHPVQYASLDTDFWRSHFYCFGRLP